MQLGGVTSRAKTNANTRNLAMNAISGQKLISIGQHHLVLCLTLLRVLCRDTIDDHLSGVASGRRL